MRVYFVFVYNAKPCVVVGKTTDRKKSFPVFLSRALFFVYPYVTTRTR